MAVLRAWFRLRIVLVVLCCWLASLGRVCWAASEKPGGSGDGSLARVLERGVLLWGGDLQGGEPYVFPDHENPHRLVGFEVEILEAIGRRLGVETRFVQNDWSTLLASLERGNFDVAVNGIEVTPARQAAYALTRPYASFRLSLLTHLAFVRDYTSLAALRGRRVGVLANSLAHDLVRGEPEVHVVLYEGVDEPLTDVEVGRLDAVVTDDIIARRYLPRHPNVTEAAVLATGSYSMVVRREDQALYAALDRALSELEQGGELRQILERWEVARPVENPQELPPPATPSLPSQMGLFLRGAGVTLLISTLAMLLAVVGGFCISLARQFGGRLLAGAAQLYVEVFRGTPVLLQLYVLYYGLAPVLAMDALTTAVVGLGMNYAAYEAELYRAGLQAVPRGQEEAALALGMPRWLALRRIVLPQAIRVALPGMANDFIALLKDSSIVSVITVVELTKQMTITAVDLRSWALPGVLCAALYLAMSVPLSRLAVWLERRLGAGQ